MVMRHGRGLHGAGQNMQVSVQTPVCPGQTQGGLDPITAGPRLICQSRWGRQYQCDHRRISKLKWRSRQRSASPSGTLALVNGLKNKLSAAVSRARFHAHACCVMPPALARSLRNLSRSRSRPDCACAAEILRVTIWFRRRYDGQACGE